MPVKVYKSGKNWAVKEVGRSGRAKKGRVHTTKAKALKQMRAINLSLIARGKIKPKRKVKASVLKAFKPKGKRK